MSTEICRRSLIGIGLLAVAGWMQPAAAEITECMEIQSIPTVISTQGVYCLKQHVSGSLASGNAITVTANNVTIDCNEFKIGNLAAGPATQAVGISASSRNNVTVRNCGVRGFQTGISLLNGGYRVENNRLDNNTRTGIFVTGSGSSIRGNEVIDTGGGTAGGTAQAEGIKAAGGMDIIDNNISGVLAAGANGTVYGIYVEDMDAGYINENRVRELVPAGLGLRRGIWVDSGNRVTLKSNSVVLNGGLLTGDAGIRCGGVILNGVAQDNTVLGAGVLGTVVSLLNCANLGGVNYTNVL